MLKLSLAFRQIPQDPAQRVWACAVVKLMNTVTLFRLTQSCTVEGAEADTALDTKAPPIPVIAANAANINLIRFI